MEFKLIEPKVYFQDLVADGMKKRGVKAVPHVATYLRDLLVHYLEAKNLKCDTLAVMLLKAQNSDSLQERSEIYKRLGDTSLYISGFFGDSLNRKIVDIDYYVQMGGTAYSSLAAGTHEDLLAFVYRDFADRFMEFVDVLAHISQEVFVQGNQSVLRLYERYLRTGSALARDKLIEMGVMAIPRDVGYKISNS